MSSYGQLLTHIFEIHVIQAMYYVKKVVLRKTDIQLNSIQQHIYEY